MSRYHQPVLLQPVCTLLDIRPGRKYIDATLGGAGHTLAILNSGGRVLGIDQDPEAIKESLERVPAEALSPALASADKTPKVILTRGNFIHLAEIADKYNWTPVWGILIDLGVSLHQIKTPQRGFSFQSAGPLDMRMDPDLPNSAATLLNVLTVKQIEILLKQYGEEPQAAYIARRIVAQRPLHTTDQLARMLSDSHQRRRVFQALRIAVNDELAALRTVLPQAFKMLCPAGRLGVITFHSLEDRIVKQQFSMWSREGVGQLVTETPVIPDRLETISNPHSSSAKLRVISKL